MIVWIDCEMTGLDPQTDKIIEIACIITTLDLEIVATLESIIIHVPSSLLETMNEWCIQHHASSGLTQRVISSTLSTLEAETILLEFIKSHVEPKKAFLGGNSVSMDKIFMMNEMPRIIDVSTVKELARSWNFNVFEKAPVKNMVHRALEDIKESIDELQYYRNNLFKLDCNK